MRFEDCLSPNPTFKSKHSTSLTLSLTYPLTLLLALQVRKVQVVVSDKVDADINDLHAAKVRVTEVTQMITRREIWSTSAICNDGATHSHQALPRLRVRESETPQRAACSQKPSVKCTYACTASTSEAVGACKEECKSRIRCIQDALVY